MAQISIIKKSNIIEAGRLDAEYFKHKYLEIEKRFADDVSLKDIAERIICGPFGSTILDGTYTKTGIEVIRPFNIKDSAIEYKNLVYISEKDVEEKNLKIFTEGDLFFARVGDIKVGILTHKKSTISPNIIAVTLDKTKIYPYFLSTFLNTKYGLLQLLRGQKIVAQPTISTNLVRNLKIPIPPQSFQLKIEKIVKTAHEKQSKAKTLYTEAEDLLLEELGLVGFRAGHTLTFSVTKKEIEGVGRFDAEYFQPKYADIIRHIENYSGGFDVVKNICDWRKGVEVGSEAYREDGRDFVRVSDFSIDGIKATNKKISSSLFNELQVDFQPKMGDILFSKDGTIGISYLLGADVEGVVSSAFLRLTLKENYQDFEKQCLVLIFNSVLCKMQVEKLSGGAIIAHLKPSDFEQFKIPLIKPKIQQQIAQKITQSQQLRTESKDLLEQAKLAVEREIEEKR